MYQFGGKYRDVKKAKNNPTLYKGQDDRVDYDLTDQEEIEEQNRQEQLLAQQQQEEEQQRQAQNAKSKELLEKSRHVREVAEYNQYLEDHSDEMQQNAGVNQPVGNSNTQPMQAEDNNHGRSDKQPKQKSPAEALLDKARTQRQRMEEEHDISTGDDSPVWVGQSVQMTKENAHEMKMQQKVAGTNNIAWSSSSPTSSNAVDVGDIDTNDSGGHEQYLSKTLNEGNKTPIHQDEEANELDPSDKSRKTKRYLRKRKKFQRHVHKAIRKEISEQQYTLKNLVQQELQRKVKQYDQQQMTTAEPLLDEEGNVVPGVGTMPPEFKDKLTKIESTPQAKEKKTMDWKVSQLIQEGAQKWSNRNKVKRAERYWKQYNKLQKAALKATGKLATNDELKLEVLKKQQEVTKLVAQSEIQWEVNAVSGVEESSTQALNVDNIFDNTRKRAHDPENDDNSMVSDSDSATITKNKPQLSTEDIQKQMLSAANISADSVKVDQNMDMNSKDWKNEMQAQMAESSDSKPIDKKISGPSMEIN